MKSEMTPNEQTLSDNMHKALGVQQAKHTPTPYHIEKFQNRYEIWKKDDGSTHSCVGSVATSVDARFIVRACNCHDDLLEACHGLLAQLEGPAMVHGDGIGRDGRKTGLSGEEFNALRRDRIESARAAIAKAEGNS